MKVVLVFVISFCSITAMSQETTRAVHGQNYDLQISSRVDDPKLEKLTVTEHATHSPCYELVIDYKSSLKTPNKRQSGELNLSAKAIEKHATCFADSIHLSNVATLDASVLPEGEYRIFINDIGEGILVGSKAGFFLKEAGR